MYLWLHVVTSDRYTYSGRPGIVSKMRYTSANSESLVKAPYKYDTVSIVTSTWLCGWQQI
jgi:hypothetical protein